MSTSESTPLLNGVTNVNTRSYLEYQRQEKLEKRRITFFTHRNYRPWYDLLVVRGSTIPAVVLPFCVLFVWATIVTTIYKTTDLLKWVPNSTMFITIMGVAFGYLLVFRTNTAYDRFWEGRRLWAQLVVQIRNFARLIWLHVEPVDGSKISKEDFEYKKGAMNLLLAFSSACKHYLRNEPGWEFDDLWPYLEHIQDFSPENPNPPKSGTISVPLEISFHLGTYVAEMKAKNLIDGSAQGSMNGCVSGMVETFSYFERIKTPIPIAYGTFIKQALFLYTLSLPFQVLPVLGLVTIPVVSLGGAVLVAMEAIAGEIENPFGITDANDLPIDDYIDSIKAELSRIMNRRMKLSVNREWGKAVDLDGFELRYEDAVASPTTLTAHSY
ncbi:Bestrophin, RFP-TM, chloride channel-domain-containing protein [Cladochytrium replicatum]|nr:Bestrophin, RFP-TM, chloride channel-domain-containing protein [Cladochytrium replicatum]